MAILAFVLGVLVGPLVWFGLLALFDRRWR